MTTNNDIDTSTQIELTQVNHPAWDEPVICRVEVDLPGWLAQLTGDRYWEVCGENEEETCISFIMRPKGAPNIADHHHLPKRDLVSKQAEVTLYHNGYAIVDVDGQEVFDGSLTSGTSDCARLCYYHVTGEPILLN